MKEYKKVIKKTNEFKISAPILNKKFELPNGSYSVSDIQDHFDYIIKKKFHKQKYINIYNQKINIKHKSYINKNRK